MKNENRTSLKTMTAIALASALMALLTTARTASAQLTQVTGELVPLGNKTGVGARALGLGEAFTGVADDYTALYYNAAGLADLGRSEAGMTLTYGMFQNAASIQNQAFAPRSLESTRLNALNLVFADCGPWALGLGYYSPVSFDDPLQYTARGSAYTYDASGRMDHYRMGLAYRLSKAVNFGLAASAISGREQLQITDGTPQRYLEEYSGFNFEPSILIHASDEFSFGASAVILEQLQLRDTYQQQGSDAVQTQYDIRHPFQCRVGLAYRKNMTLVSADWHGDFWSGYRYSQAGAAFLNQDAGYPNRHTFSIGIEQGLFPHGPTLRAGYLAETADNSVAAANVTQPYRLSAGLGFAPDKAVSMDFAYQYGNAGSQQNSQVGGPADLHIQSEQHQVMGSLRYRW